MVANQGEQPAVDTVALLAALGQLEFTVEFTGITIRAVLRKVDGTVEDYGIIATDIKEEPHG